VDLQDDQCVKHTAKFTGSMLGQFADGTRSQTSAHIADKGILVHKRVIKLLKLIDLMLNEEEWIDLS